MHVTALGATGMLGHHASEAVRAAGFDLTTTYRSEASRQRLLALGGRSVRADLDDADSLVAALRGSDALIHAAAYYPTVPRPWRDEVATARAQLARVLDAAAEAKVSRVVYVGAAIALPKRDDGAPSDGQASYPGEPAWKNPYLQVKWAMDALARERAAQGQPVCIGIPAMTFGEHDHGPSTGQIITRIARGTMPKFVDGRRNVVHAGDAGRGLVLAAERGVPGTRYLLTGSNTTMAELTATIARQAGVSAPTPLPLGVAKLVGRAQALRHRFFGGAPPVISETAIAVMAGGQWLDGRVAQRDLGYAPEVDLEQTVARALAWFRANGYC